MKDRPSLLRTLSLFWFVITAALCVVIMIITPEQISSMFNVDVEQISRFGAIGNLIGSQLQAIDTIIGKVILTAMVVIVWAAGRFAILCAAGLANLTYE